MGKIIFKLDELMSERNISISELAAKLHLLSGDVDKIKNGKITAVSFSTLAKLCEIFDCEPGDLLEYVDD